MIVKKMFLDFPIQVSSKICLAISFHLTECLINFQASGCFLNIFLKDIYVIFFEVVI